MPSNKPVFSPGAWHKYILLRDMGDTEISAMGVCNDPANPFVINDLFVPHQTCSGAYTEFDDDALSESHEVYGAREDPENPGKIIGMKPYQYSRIWLHTHPGNSASPSGTDHKTFAEEFGHPDWAIMFILARGGQTHCEFKVRDASGLATAHVRHDSNDWVDWNIPFTPVDVEALKALYKERVKSQVHTYYTGSYGKSNHAYHGNYGWSNYKKAGREPLDLGDIDWRYKREDYLMKQYLQAAYKGIKTCLDAEKVMKHESFADMYDPDEVDWEDWMDERWAKGLSCKIEFMNGDEVIYECDDKEAATLVFNGKEDTSEDFLEDDTNLGKELGFPKAWVHV